MDYTILTQKTDLRRISSIKEEEEIDIDTKNELGIVREINETLKSSNLHSPKRYTYVENSSDPFDDLLENANTGYFSNQSSRKSKRFGFKVSSNPDTEFPLLVRGFDLEKNKEAEVIRRRSLKDTFFYQTLIDESKDDSMPNKNDTILLQVDSLEEDDMDENLLLKSVSMLGEDMASVSACNSISYENSIQIFNQNALNKVIYGEEPFEVALYLALNENASEIPEGKSTFLEKIGFSNAKKEKVLIEVAFEGWQKVENSLAEYQKKNKILKKQLENLRNDNKKAKSEYSWIKSSINSTLSNVSEEKISGVKKIANIDLQINEAAKIKTELYAKYRDDYKAYSKLSEEYRETEEIWNMNINDLRVKTINVLEKNIIFKEKIKKNLKIMNELKQLEKLKIFQKDQIDFSFEMLGKTIDFFAQSKENEIVNVSLT